MFSVFCNLLDVAQVISQYMCCTLAYKNGDCSYVLPDDKHIRTWRTIRGRHKTLATTATHNGKCPGGFLGGGRAPCPGPRGTSSRMGPSIRCDDDPSHPCGVRLVQLCLIGQEQSVWHSADTRWDPDSYQPLIII